ncbi:hypothetical protein L4174_003050 [Photobacterium sp. CCB-ST2H9]|uniref:hypothetical protein n=1 Tax=unclassified Photobacterium TaxID=2628852 RepID=UPI00200393D1|nr:hypothetical protein [Photobacterium sp. CCB-ST2H9]UTM57866.1 hypothetical protein L4174_003050 [Photobacterium sp. CCB-ST2H9]
MNKQFKVGKETLLDPNAVEYQWIRNLDSDGNSAQQINTVIQRCLGGSPQTADTMRKVALNKIPVHQLFARLREEE